MNRREAIAALMSLPSVARIRVASLKPSDVIVLESDDEISDHARERIQATAKQVWPDHKVVVLQRMTMKVVSAR